MGKIPKTPKAKIPARQPDQGINTIALAEETLTNENTDHDKQDVALLSAVLGGSLKLFGRDWDKIKDAANDRGEGEIVVTLKVNIPFGKQEQEVHSEISFGGLKFRDEDVVKVEDPAQLKLAGVQ